MNAFEVAAADALRTLLAAVPAIREIDVSIDRPKPDARPDFVAHFSVGGLPRVLLAEATSNGQPKHVRAALHKLGQRVDAAPPGAAAILTAPYLSEEARALCRDSGVGFFDLEGNCRIAFDSVYIERTSPTRPAVVRRDLKSLFKPKAARVLRMLLRDPNRAWKVTDLAEAAVVSVGHVSHVRRALIDREWAVADRGGLRLNRLNTLLAQFDIAPASVRLLRHQDGRAERGKTPYELWRDHRPAFEVYQGAQRTNNRAKLRGAYWASFVGTPSGDTLLAGFYVCRYLGLNPVDIPWPHAV